LDVAAKKLTEAVLARAEIEKQRSTIDAQIIFWKNLVDSLRAVFPEEEEDPLPVEISAFVEGNPGKQTVKFTDGVRMVFKERRDAILTAPDVRTGLTNLGFDFSKYQQPLTPIHNCLKRLEEQGEIKAEKFPGGRIVGYKWISPIERALDDENSFYTQTGEGLVTANSLAKLFKPKSPTIYENMAEMALREKDKKEGK
jgi:hypothetical protein